jgi:methylglyoxal synthase
MVDILRNNGQMKFALIAHDNKKADMVAFVMKRLDFFNREDVKIVTTGTTGKHCEHAGITKVEKVSSGPLGGDAEIGAMVTRGEITGVIFMRDPLDKHPHDVDISMLMRLCDVHNVPLATNYKTASILIKWFKQTQI